MQTIKRRDTSFNGNNGELAVTYKDIPGRKDVTKGSWRPPGWNGTEVTRSENHPEWLRRRPGDVMVGDVGGEFFNQKTYVIGHDKPWPIVGLTGYKNKGLFNEQRAEYKGVLLPDCPTLAGSCFPPITASARSGLDSWGTKAIALCKPTDRVANALQTLIELYREGLPKLIGSATWKAGVLRARDAGHEYLNVEFGFKPLANDIAKFMATVVDCDRLIRQYERDSGRLVRRRMSFPPERSIDVSKRSDNVYVTVPSSSLLTDPSSTNQGSTYRIREVEVRRWFTGAFCYHIPDYNNNRYAARPHMSQAERLLGLELTPEVLWELAPWSWAVDWFTNLGDVISNLTSWFQDGLVLKYGYIMEHSKCSDTYVYIGQTKFWSGSSPAPVTFVTETKQRQRATPFGFGVLLSALTDRQKAIAAAIAVQQ